MACAHVARKLRDSATSASPGPFRYILAKGHSGCIASSYALYSGADGGLRFYVSDQGGTNFTTSSDAGAGIWDGNWHHVAGTFDGAAVRLYVDGVEVGAPVPRTGPIGYNGLDGDDLFLGHYPGCAGLHDDGAIDDARVYDATLVATAIVAPTRYDFAGFYTPVNNLPTINGARAGSAIPLKFSLGGDQGLGIFAAGSPSSRTIACDTGAPSDDIEETDSPGGSTLKYDPYSDRYHYVWKTSKAWSGSCRELTVALIDGTSHTARFRLK